MSNTALKAAATGQAAPNPLVAFSSFMDKFKPQLALALPKHMTADRMARLALTAFSTTPALQACDPKSIAGAIMIAGQLGLEIGVNGHGFLIPYGRTCTFVPGWKGLQDLVNRSGRATTWTGAVYEGDQFDYGLGDSPFVEHKPGEFYGEADKMTHVYAIGRVNGSNWPIVEVWPMSKVWRHRDRYNKMGQKHYSHRDPEMYARKVALLQVLKYVPSSIEVSNAVAVANASEVGQRVDIIDNCVTVADIGDMPDEPAGALSGADFIKRIESAADKENADDVLAHAMSYGLPKAQLDQVEKAYTKKWAGQA